MFCYDFEKIESKWQLNWTKNKTFKTSEDLTKPKFYCLDMFPYPSSQGLHVGHIEGYTASDIVNRLKRMQQYNVLHPFGWDSFGLPAEQYALNTGNHPKDFTYENINNFKKQIEKLGKGVDWERELSTSEPYFYQWTQWIFKKLYEKNLASLQEIEVNFCEELGTVLANEEVVPTEDGLVSERGSHPVVKKKMKQWVLKITDYAERLLDDLDLLEWSPQLKEMQKNWIGKKEGFIFVFSLLDVKDKKISVFTTKPSTIFGVTALFLAPEHPLVAELTTPDRWNEIDEYVKRTKRKTNLERDINKEKTGVFIGSYAINFANQKKIPIWIADYVLPHYGTGAIMAVPYHDSRDFEFARKYDLEMIPIAKLPEETQISPSEKKELQEEKEIKVEDGIFINSDVLNGLNYEEANSKIIAVAQKNNWGQVNFTYQMHDWVFSRQRYWGEPFPVYYDENDNIYLNSDAELPLELPSVEKIVVSGDGTSPLSNISSWIYFEKDGKKFRRDSNTMPQLAGSSWYYIGYILKNYLGMIPLNTDKAKELLDYFLPVDFYIGGTEHAVGHLLYSRFWHKFLFDLGLVSSKEPFLKLVNQGMILGHDNLKMSKSKENAVNASLILEKYGSDVLRIYMMFMGPLEDSKSWSEQGLKGVQRFLNRVYNMFDSFEVVSQEFTPLKKIMNQTIKIVTEDYENLKFNKVVSQLMIFVNEAYKHQKIDQKQMKIFLQLLNPLAPHLTEELNQTVLEYSEELVYSQWPTYDETLLTIDTVDIVVQINGKVKTKIKADKDQEKKAILELALKDNKIANLVEKGKIVKTIYVPNKLLNLVVCFDSRC
ncbi:MAG: Leucine--tRNA ligase [Candidatus Phytoplasma pruni]